jgi:hypothetical protein
MTYGTWQPDGTGIRPGGDAGGDIQAGNSFSVRYVRPDLPGSLITRTAYAVENVPGEFTIQIQTEWLVCTDPRDPGGTEIWSDYAYDDEGCPIWSSVGEAEDAAREGAAKMLGEAEMHDWDGQPDRGTR